MTNEEIAKEVRAAVAQARAMGFVVDQCVSLAPDSLVPDEGEGKGTCCGLGAVFLVKSPDDAKRYIDEYETGVSSAPPYFPFRTAYELGGALLGLGDLESCAFAEGWDIPRSPKRKGVGAIDLDIYARDIMSKNPALSGDELREQLVRCRELSRLGYELAGELLR